MFDTDGNEMVDKKEFLVVCIFSVFEYFYVILKFLFLSGLRLIMMSIMRTWAILQNVVVYLPYKIVNSGSLLQCTSVLCVMIFEA